MSALSDALAQPSERRLKVLFFDIETAPMLAFIWQAKTEYVNTGQIQHETFMLTWAAKWWDSDEVMGANLTSKEAIAQDDSRIVGKLADLIREADYICGHNVNGFDLPMLNNRVLLHGLEPLGPVQTLDTLKLARRSFRLASNKLDWLAEQLGIGNKIGTSFSLWERCYRGEPAAFRQMLEYNKKDVTLLQEVYERIAPYVKGALPRLVDAAYQGEHACPSCGSHELVPDGVTRTNASTFPKFKCSGCGRGSRSRAAQKPRALGLTPL